TARAGAYAKRFVSRSVSSPARRGTISSSPRALPPRKLRTPPFAPPSAPRSRPWAAKNTNEIGRSCGAALLQGRGQPDAAAGVPLHADMLGVRHGGGGAFWRDAWRLARGEATALMPPMVSRRI